MAVSDHELVTRSQKGDRGAFEELVRRTGRLVFARIYLEIGNSDYSEDLVQETFLVAFRSIQQVHDPKGFRSWLYAVAHSVVIDAHRHNGRKKRAKKREKGVTLSSMPSKQPEPHELAEKAETRKQVLTILRSLPEEYRVPLMLRYLAGSDYETISRQLGLSNGSLRGMLNRGMELLRTEMKKLEETRSLS